MKVAVLFFPTKRSSKLQKITRSLQRGIELQGHQVDIINGSKNADSKLSMYQYIAIGMNFSGIFSSKPPSSIASYLKNAGMINGKRSFAFILPKLFAVDKSLRRLMALMEAEGMFVNFSEIISNEQTALEIGKRLKIAK